MLRRLLAVVLGLAIGLGVTTISVSASPDRASRIVFVRWPLRSGSARLWTMDADGTRMHRMPTPESSGNDLEPSWSPDGSHLAFAHVSKKGNQGQLFTVGRNGLHLDPLTPSGLDADSPTWSPDGSLIAFSAKRVGDDSPPQIWVIRADGTGLHVLTRGRADHVDPAWSPDGTNIAYVRRRSFIHGEHPQTVGRLHILDLDDGTDTVIMSLQGHVTASPDWAPDGSSIVFVGITERVFVTKIWSLHPDGSDAHVVRASRSGAVDGAPTWSPGGGELAFVEESYRSRNNWMRLMVMNAGGGHARTLLRSENAFLLEPDWTASRQA